MRVGVVHAAANVVAMSLYGASLLARGPRLGRTLRLAGLASAAASGLAGGHISFRLAGGANHAEQLPDLPVARQRVPARRRVGGPRARHRASAGVPGARGRRRNTGLPARSRLTRTR